MNPALLTVLHICCGRDGWLKCVLPSGQQANNGSIKQRSEESAPSDVKITSLQWNQRMLTTWLLRIGVAPRSPTMNQAPAVLGPVQTPNENMLPVPQSLQSKCKRTCGYRPPGEGA